MQISEEGLNLIIEFEGFRANPYHCSAGVSTIGYGTTTYPNGTKVQMSDPAITEEQARRYMESTINDTYAKCVNDNALPATQEQFDAMTSFTYNLGCGNFKSSTLLKKHNAGDHEQAVKEFLRWNKANGKVLAGLTRRREAESEMYKGVQ